jgi:putative molybdopterin biosynthesis protein
MPESIYLQDVPFQEAWARFRSALEQHDLWRPLEVEFVPLQAALGRITAKGLTARISSPHYHAAAMDGYAVSALQTAGASDRAPVSLRSPDEAEYVDTGDPLPAWADAVVPIELVEIKDPDDKDTQIVFRESTHPWSHVRHLGEDMVATELVLPSGQRVRPVDIGAAAGSGYAELLVWRKPRVAIIPSGSELVAAGSDPEPGEIIEYNSLVLAAQVETWGGEPLRTEIVPDDREAIVAAVRSAAKSADLVLLNAGSSAGSGDFSAYAVETLGQLLVHGVAIRPGHPVILGLVQLDERVVPIIGVPGYPASAALTGEIFVQPILARWLGTQPAKPQTVNATLTRKVHSSLGDDEYLRVSVARVGDRLVAAPLARGAGVISSLVRADGLVLIPSGVQGHPAGAEVKVRLYRTAEQIEHTLLIMGSHDLTLDLLGQHLAVLGARLSSASIGSLGGLLALRRREAHLAGCHLLDPASGEYNLPYIQKHLPDLPVTVLKFVDRMQGLIVAHGNPKAIAGLADLERSDLRFVNRQRGAGTRVLLDYELDRLGISTAAISGYDDEQFTHLTVAAAIAAGRADCGLGVQAAADALGLDFIPLVTERYDLVFPTEHYRSDKLASLLEVVRSGPFADEVKLIPGYSTEGMGEVIAELN